MTDNARMTKLFVGMLQKYLFFAYDRIPFHQSLSHLLIESLLKPSQNKKGLNSFLAAPKMLSFSKLSAVKKDTVFGAARKNFDPEVPKLKNLFQ